MIEKRIEHIAYQLKKNKEEGKPGAIVFIGAGCSVSAGIPTAKEIVDDVIERYKDHPDVKYLDKKPSYLNLMKCLGPSERKEIFKDYVDKAKINVSHIYLAHLINQGYVDYIVTVNFDNLAQRALALYNIFPAIYDISTIKDLTTTTLDTKSVIYLHGQHNGLWQLNTEEEMEKVSDSVVASSILNKITNNRLWIVVGYSGEDFVFNQLVELGRFDNGLYWIGYKNHEPSERRVQTGLLNKSNTGSFFVKGYDSDSFFLKLNAELGSENPKIFDTPFSFLSELQENIKDIDDTEDYKAVKERFIASKEMVLDAINKYELSENKESTMTDKEIKHAQLQKALINCLINEKYDDELVVLEQQVNKKERDLMLIVSNIYYSWGTNLGNLASTKSPAKAEVLYMQAFEKFSKAIEIEPDDPDSYYNWGYYLGELAATKSGQEAEELYNQSFKKLSKAIEIKSDEHEGYSTLGYYLGKLSRTKSGVEAEALYLQAFDKYKKAIEIKPSYETYNNWGTCLGDLAVTKSGAEAEVLYLQAFDKYKKAIEINPDYRKAYNNWGVYLRNFAETKSGGDAEALYFQAIEKHKKAIEIKPSDYDAYNYWGSCLEDLAKTKSGADAKNFSLQAFEKYKKAMELGGSSYNLACYYALTKNLSEAFRLVEISLQKNEITFKHVEEDTDWNELREEPKYKELKKLYSA